MHYALVRSGEATALVRNKTIVVGGTKYPHAITERWSLAELAAIGIYPIVEGTVPEGHRSTGTSLVFAGGTVTREHATETIPAPTAQELATARVSAKRRMASYADETVKQVTGEVPEAERDSWYGKGVAARSFIAAPGAISAPDLALLQAEATITGETIADLSAAIVIKADIYLSISGQVAGLRRAIGTAIDAASTNDEIEAALAAGLAQAEAAMAVVLGS